MSFQTEREMLFWERNRYIQVCRENEYAVLYYDNKEEKIIRYKTGKKFSFSLKYQLCILVTLYLGYLLNAKFYTVLAQNIFLKHLIIWTSVSAIILLLFYRTNFVLILVIFLASVIALSAMAAATRPVLRAKTYKRLENRKK